MYPFKNARRYAPELPISLDLLFFKEYKFITPVECFSEFRRHKNELTEGESVPPFIGNDG